MCVVGLLPLLPARVAWVVTLLLLGLEVEEVMGLIKGGAAAVSDSAPAPAPTAMAAQDDTGAAGW